MAFVIPLALAGLAFVADRGVKIGQSTIVPSVPRSNLDDQYQQQRTGGRKQINVSQPKLQIQNGPLYTIPGANFIEEDDARIARQLEQVEATSELFEDRNAARQAQDPQIEKLLNIVRSFIKDKQLVIYGGTALNALMPKQDAFYDYKMEIPDYDFFSSDAQQDAMELADRFYAAGYKDAQARSGVHPGTYKVSANFTQLADITQMDQKVLEQMDIVRQPDGLLYAGPIYLRIDLYKQLSEQNQTLRWPKIWYRMQLLNRNYPLPCKKDSIKPMLCLTANSLPADQLADVVVEFLRNKKSLDSTGLPIVGSTLLPLYEKLGYEISPELRAQLENYKCLMKEVPAVDLFSMQPKEDAVELVRMLSLAFPTQNFTIVTAPEAKEILEDRWIITTAGGNRLVEFARPEKCLAITKVNDTYFGTLDTILAVMFSKLFVDTKLVSAQTKGKQLCLLQLLMDEIKNNVQYGASTGRYARFPQVCYGPSQNLSDIFRERWQERVNRLIAVHKGEAYPGSGAFSYRPNDISLARQGLVDQRLAVVDFPGEGKMSII